MNKQQNPQTDVEQFKSWIGVSDYLANIIDDIPHNLSAVFESLQDVDKDGKDTEKLRATGINEALIEEKIHPALFDALDVVRMIIGYYTEKFIKDGTLPVMPTQQPPTNYQQNHQMPHTPPNSMHAYTHHYRH